MEASCQLTLAKLPPAGGSSANRPTSAHHPQGDTMQKGQHLCKGTTDEMRNRIVQKASISSYITLVSKASKWSTADCERASKWSTADCEYVGIAFV